MTTRGELAQSIATLIADYREGDVPRRTPEDVERWISQFPRESQNGILSEINALLAKTYITRERMTAFLRGLVAHEKFCAGDPQAFWRHANLLDIQGGGNSQRELLAIFGGLLQQELGITLGDCGSKDGPFIYLDDGVFGGGRVVQDLSKWIKNTAPEQCEVRVVVAALHTLGKYYVDKTIDALKETTKKKIKLSWWRIDEFENRLYYKEQSDVLWPTAVPVGALAEAYVRYVTQEEPKQKIALRAPGSVGTKRLFSSDAARILLEQELLTAGLAIRDRSPNLPASARPLEATLLKTFGFGSTLVTFRNCPNNCPLAFWVGDPWYPLFPRSTNSEAFIGRVLESFRGTKGTGR